jgi:signal transduction histidine kinase/DNA-binding response OmpR family regulator
VGIAGLKQSARLAGLAGGVLLLLLAPLAWLGTARTGLDVYWFLWAAVPAVAAAFGGPLLGGRLLSRRMLNRWRLLLSGVMAANTAAWAFAAAVAASAGPPALPVLVIAWLALSLALLPSLSWLPGLSFQLAVQLAFTAWMAYFPGPHGDIIAAPLAFWLALALLAWTGALYARRVELASADLHCLRFEAAELQRQLAAEAEAVAEADRRNRDLEGELAEILSLAEDASRAKTEFLATMSHEIRTPLNGILPILEMLRETPLNQEQHKMIQAAQGSSRHLLRIINDILDFAKVESGKLQLEAIELDVRDLVGSVTELMAGSASNRNLKLTASVSDAVPQVVRGDPIRLRQVLINLVSNAIKFTEEGGIRVEVSLGETSQKEVELLFAVADTGIGMSTDTAERLFQSFTQADASTTRKHGGTGLGLVICKRLVELMGGKIGVRSAPGQGSTFWFLVPLRKSVMEVPSARRNLAGLRVLTLAGDPDGAARLSGYLRTWGLVEEKAADPAEALGKLRSVAMLGESWAYDLGVIDGTGIEQRLPGLLGEIRAIDSLRRMPLVVAMRSETLAHKLKRDFGAVVLTDGLRPEPLRRMLHRLFDVETRHFGNAEMRPEEIYDDLNVLSLEVPVQRSSRGAGGEFSGRVLLVEDNAVNLGVVCKALDRFGLDCATATDGAEALAAFEGGRFDLVFMDCQMPVMDGYESTRQMRERERLAALPRTPIVAMTANAMAGDRERCLEAGMDDYLAKPVSMDALRNCLAAWLSGRAGGSPESRPTRTLAVEPAGEKEMDVLDEKVLSELREIMEDDYVSLLRTYLHNAPQLISDARDAIARSDPAALVLPVHSLKSSSANVGAMLLSEKAREVERLARGGDLAAARAAFEAIETAYGQAAGALEAQVRLAASA